MLVAMGPRRQHLSLLYECHSLTGRQRIEADPLVPALLLDCPLLTHLEIDDLRFGKIGMVWSHERCLHGQTKQGIDTWSHAMLTAAGKYREAAAPAKVLSDGKHMRCRFHNSKTGNTSSYASCTCAAACQRWQQCSCWLHD